MKKIILQLSALLTLAAVAFSGCALTGGSSKNSETQVSSISVESKTEQSSEASAELSMGGSGSSEEESEASHEESTPPPSQIKLTIPEGYTLAKIGMTLESKGVCTAAEFIEAAQNGDFSSYPLFALQQPNENRCFKLEGYLFPDTYQIAANSTPDAIIRKMLDDLEGRMDENLRAQLDKSAFSFDEILTIASVIEKEAFGLEEMPKIASVIYNRLTIGQKLEMDVSIKYVEGAIKPFISGDIDRYNSYYNTYKCPALPAGPICNPGKAAINAALNPADTPYYFFVTDVNKKYYYAQTYEEHLENCKTAGVNVK